MLSATCVYSDFKKAVYVDISPTEKYTVVAYRVYTMFYDNEAKTEHKIEIGNCTSAFFTPNELYLILFTQTTMFIYSISTGEIIGSESKGALVCKPVIYNDTVFFCVRRKYNHTVFQYDIINGTLIPRQMNSYKCGRPYESLWGDENKGIVQTWTTPTLNGVCIDETDRDKYPMVIGHSELSFDKFVNYCLVPFDERMYAVSERKDGWYSFCYKVLLRRSFYGFKFPEGTDKLIAIDHSDDNIFFAMQNAVYICDKDIADVLFTIETKKCTRFSVCSNVNYFMIKDNDKLKLYLYGTHDDCEHFLFENLDEFYNFHYINSLSLSINYANYLMRITDDEEKAFKAFFDNLKTFCYECKNTAESIRIILENIDKDFPDKSISFDDTYKKLYKYDKIFEEKQSFYRMKYLIDKYDTQIDFSKKTKIESFYVFIKDRLCLMNDIISNMQTVF